MTEQKNLSDQELKELLPFYVNLTLDPPERASVEDYLARSEEARREVLYLRELRKSLKAQPQATSPGELGLKRLQREIKRLKESPESAEPGEVPAPAAELLPFRGHESQNPGEETATEAVPAWWRKLAIAACAALVLLGGVSLSRQFLHNGDSPQLAGDGSAAVLQVTFKPQVTENAIRSLLLEYNLTITAGPSALGIYELSFFAGESGKDLETILRQLRERNTVIESAEVR